MAKQRVVLKFFDGSETAGSLQSPFDPVVGELSVALAGEGNAIDFRLRDLCFVTFFGAVGRHAREWRTLEEVTTVTGESFKVHIPEAEIFANGFFGFPTEDGTDWEAIFFSLQGVRRRQLSERVGEILVRHGALPEEGLKAALAEQERLRTRRVGEIIAETSNLSRDAIEETLAGAAQRSDLPKTARVGDILVAAGLVTRQQVEAAVAAQKQGQRKKIGDLLIESGLITENQLVAALAAKFRLQVVDLATADPQEEALAALSSGMAHRLKALPLARRGNALTVAIAAPTDHTILDSLHFATSCSIELVVAYEADISAALDRYYPPGGSVGSILGQLHDEIITVEEEESGAEVKESDSQVINLVNRLLVEALRKGVSDLHFEPGPGSAPLLVRHRIDGNCQVAYKVAGHFKRAVIARLKIMSNLDIAERRRPQSGKILLRAGRKFMEFRLEVTPTVGGLEDAVLRVLGSARPLPLDQLEFSGENHSRFVALLEKPYGIILCVGPTGSGKTTTLHSALALINTPERKIWTVEDPVEITQHGLRQVSVNPKIGFSFPEALRSFLRADPDIIMVGEMRDVETAKIASAGVPHRAPGAQHPAYQQRPGDDHPPDRYGHGPLQLLRCPARDPGPAPGSAAVQRLPQSRASFPGRIPGAGSPVRRRPVRCRRLAALDRGDGPDAPGGMRAVPGVRLPGAAGPARIADRFRGDPRGDEAAACPPSPSGNWPSARGCGP